MTPPSLKPLLKWPGSKHKLAPKIAARFPEGACAGRLYDPFAGSVALYLHLAPRLSNGAVLTDINVGLINFHRVVQSAPDALLEELRVLPQGTNWREGYYAIRERYNGMRREGPVAAAILLWLNRTAFNGLYRENAGGGMNSPQGDYVMPSFPAEPHIRDVSAALQPAQLNAVDYAGAMRGAARGDWLYLDPPYDPVTSTAAFVGYSRAGFNGAEQDGLAEEAVKAVRRGAVVVASNSGTPRMLELWRGAGFQIEEFNVRRSISCRAATRGQPVPEILAWNGGLDVLAS